MPAAPLQGAGSARRPWPYSFSSSGGNTDRQLSRCPVIRAMKKIHTEPLQRITLGRGGSADRVVTSRTLRGHGLKDKTGRMRRSE